MENRGGGTRVRLGAYPPLSYRTVTSVGGWRGWVDLYRFSLICTRSPHKCRSEHTCEISPALSCHFRAVCQTSQNNLDNALTCTNVAIGEAVGVLVGVVVYM